MFVSSLAVQIDFRSTWSSTRGKKQLNELLRCRHHPFLRPQHSAKPISFHLSRAALIPTESRGFWAVLTTGRRRIPFSRDLDGFPVDSHILWATLSSTPWPIRLAIDRLGTRVPGWDRESTRDSPSRIRIDPVFHVGPGRRIHSVAVAIFPVSCEQQRLKTL